MPERRRIDARSSPGPVPARETPGPAEPMVVLGRVLGAYGVAGWIKLETYTESPEALFEYGTWYGRAPGSEAWQAMRASTGRMHGGHVVAQVAGVVDREAAGALKGWEIGVPRSSLPRAGKDEIYWADLVGLEVVNREGKTLGRVRGVIEHGAHPILQVTPVESPAAERLIPCVPAVIDAIDVAARRIEVDWGEDY